MTTAAPESLRGRGRVHAGDRPGCRRAGRPGGPLGGPIGIRNGGRCDGWCGGWWLGAERRLSPNQGPRPRGPRRGAVTLAVLHAISLPPGHYGGDAVERLFRNRLVIDEHPYYERLRGLRVSAHFFVRRSGRTLQFVSVRRRAWHAGVSNWRGRDGCNDFSVGIELEGLEGLGFEPAQYRALARLLRALARRWPLGEATGHEHVAPGRKHDPGPGFDWPALQRSLRGLPLALAPLADRPAPGPATALHSAPKRPAGKAPRASRRRGPRPA